MDKNPVTDQMGWSRTWEDQFIRLGEVTTSDDI
jgi:hypothetical protein